MKMFKLPCGGLMTGAQKGYNGVVATYLTKTQQDHYVQKSRYVTAQANGKARVGRLETLTEILTFRQGNRFALCFLIYVMLTVEKEPINQATWFFQKLQNELIVVQCKARKPTSTLIKPTLTTIKYFY